MEPSSTPALTLEGLTAGYGARIVLNRIDLTLRSGEMAAIIGPNGAGKTTLFKVISGLISPTDGRVTLQGRSVEAIRPRERARILGVVPQSMECPMAFTVEQVVMLGRPSGSRLSGIAKNDLRIVENAMALTDVLDMRDRFFNELSGGERQRVTIAMALAQQPDILLLDEATSHLDINHRLDVMQIVERLNRERGLTVLSISHDLDLAAEFFHRLILLHNGGIVADDTPRHVLTPDRLTSVYGCDVGVDTNTQTGAIRVAPLIRRDAAAPGKGLQIHVIGGGGCSEAIMRRLCRASYTVTTGVLNRGDSDAVTAEALDIDTSLTDAFSPISDRAWEAALNQIDACCALIVSHVPFGPGNLRNLELAQRALQAAKPVFLADALGSRDYTPTKAATKLAETLIKQGAIPWQHLPELMEQLPHRLGHSPSLKQVFPFRLGTSSFIVPADITTNVSVLGDIIDDVELLFFESDDASNLPSPVDCKKLAALARDHNLSYTVHLPLDTWLGSPDEEERRASLARTLTVINRTRDLAPFAYILHLHGDKGDHRTPVPSTTDIPRWQTQHARSITELLETSGIPSRLFAVETLAYDFAHAAPLIEQFDLSVCLDIGHLLLGDKDVDAHIDRWIDRTRVVHLHGISDGHDHRAVTHLPKNDLTRWLGRFAEPPGQRVVTIEVFSEADWLESARALQEQEH